MKVLYSDRQILNYFNNVDLAEAKVLYRMITEIVDERIAIATRKANIITPKPIDLKSLEVVDVDS